MTMEDAVLLSARGLVKHYFAVQALTDANVDILRGEVHALIGSNGAGKSTLVKILTGAISADAGDITINGRRVPPGDPKASLDLGIACIYQESNLVPALSVMDNIVLGRHPAGRLGWLDRKTQRAAVADLLAKHELHLNLDAPVQALTTVQQKQVEIAKALSSNAQVILMDEPTAWLSQVEVENLFRSIRNLKRQGVSLLYISHVLDEIFRVADRVTVVRDGRIVSTTPISQTTKTGLTQAMLGRELSAETSQQQLRGATASGAVALACRGLGKAGLFRDISFEVRRGEIVCITGLVGAKRSEVVRALFGANPADEGEICINGQPVELGRPVDAIQHGIGLVPEDRRRDGLLMSLSMGNNLALSYLSLVTRMGLISQKLLRALGQKQIARMSIVPPRLDLPVRNLSGGNQQKVLMGRWLAGPTQILILDEPTVGIDVGAKADIYQLLRQLAANGAAVLIVSSDMEEVMTVSDRILVMAQGRLVGSFLRDQVTQQQILQTASGEAVP
jgi:ABC-type sugar transport system ATPase subunit